MSLCSCGTKIGGKNIIEAKKHFTECKYVKENSPLYEMFGDQRIKNLEYLQLLCLSAELSKYLELVNNLINEQNQLYKIPEENKERDIIESYQTRKCMSCQKTSTKDFVFFKNCNDGCCQSCGKFDLRNHYYQNLKLTDFKCKSCQICIDEEDKKKMIGSDVYEEYEKNSNLITYDAFACKKCNTSIQGIDPNIIIKNKSKNTIAKCNSCKAEQCFVCLALPYHKGMTCIENFKKNPDAEFLSSNMHGKMSNAEKSFDAKPENSKQDQSVKQNCRFCKKPLNESNLSILAFRDICKGKECSELIQYTSNKFLKCGHPNCGAYDEEIPCLFEGCKNPKLIKSKCMICSTSELIQSPCIQAKCGHIFHHICIKRRLEKIKINIRFDFCTCPICYKFIELENRQNPLTQELKKKKDQLQQALSIPSIKKRYENNKIYSENAELESVQSFQFKECPTCKKLAILDKNEKDINCENCPGKKIEQKPLPVPCKKHNPNNFIFKCYYCCAEASDEGTDKRKLCFDCLVLEIESSAAIKPCTKQKCILGSNHGTHNDIFLYCNACQAEQQN